MNTVIEDKVFEGIDFTTEKIKIAEYEYCTFVNCNFNEVDLSYIIFTECEFENCNLSLVKMLDTAMHDVKLKSCKILGVHFEDCNDFSFSVHFNNCQLNLSSFYKCMLKNSSFIKSNLSEVDFTDTDLTLLVFTDCDFNAAMFENTNLFKSDLRTSFNYIINPETNNISKAKFSKSGLAGLLQKYDIVIE